MNEWEQNISEEVANRKSRKIILIVRVVFLALSGIAAWLWGCLEWTFTGILLLLIVWWYFGGAAFAAWMTEYKTNHFDIISYKKIFYADVVTGFVLITTLIIGFIRLKTK